jgi:lysozyme family protein
MNDTFTAALDFVLRHEGGYADNPRDPGGATNLGITRATLARWRGRAVAKAEVRALSRAEAGRIYRALYWNAISADALPAGLDLALFDFAVNSGPVRAVCMLQRLLGVATDSVIGPKTLAAIARSDLPALIRALCARRTGFLQRLPVFSLFGRGWQRRLDELQVRALRLAGLTPSLEPKEDPMFSGIRDILSSKTVWGALVALAAQLFALSGLHIAADVQSSSVDFILQLVGIFGAGVALWGRIVAGEKTR